MLLEHVAKIVLFALCCKYSCRKPQKFKNCLQYITSILQIFAENRKILVQYVATGKGVFRGGVQIFGGGFVGWSVVFHRWGAVAVLLDGRNCAYCFGWCRDVLVVGLPLVRGLWCSWRLVGWFRGGSGRRSGILGRVSGRSISRLSCSVAAVSRRCKVHWVVLSK